MPMLFVNAPKVTCPYCATSQNTVPPTDKQSQIYVEVCDTEQGGCGKLFGVEVTAFAKAEIYTMKKATDKTTDAQRLAEQRAELKAHGEC